MTGARALPILVAVTACLGVCASFIGCTQLTTVGKSPLRPARMTSDTVALDIFFVKHGIDDVSMQSELWKEIDEQEIDIDVRRRLAEEGFRVGVIGTKMPAALERRMNLREKAPEIAEQKVEDLAKGSDVEQRHLQSPPGNPAEILASSIYPELSIFRRGADGVSGRAYKKAQGVFALKTFPQADGRVKIELTPELLYGDPRQRYREREGGIVLETGRDRETFDSLRLEALIEPGESVVLTCDPTHAGGIGRNFFTVQDTGELRQKLLVIRLSQTQHDPLWGAEP